MVLAPSRLDSYIERYTIPMPYDRNECIREALRLAKALSDLADEGEALEVSDDGCAVMCGVIRDCAYKIRRRAEQEREDHRMRGVWTSSNVKV
jgi:hypothetical protein